MANEPDSNNQKGRLEEELDSKGQLLIVYPKFNCELNFIKRHWCWCKWYARENCQYTLPRLGETVPGALKSVSRATIHRHYLHYIHTIDTYAAGVKYGREGFNKRVIKVIVRLSISRNGKQFFGYHSGNLSGAP